MGRYKMGNQAQQSQELELWEVVNSSKNRNIHSRQVRTRRQNTQPNYNRQNTRNSREQTIDIIPQRQIQNRRVQNKRIQNNNGAQNIYSTRSIRQTTTKTSIDRVETAKVSNRSRTIRKNTIQADITHARINTAAIRQPRSQYREPDKIRASIHYTKAKKARRRASIGQYLAFLWITAMCVAITFMAKTYYENRNTAPIVMRNIEKQSESEKIVVEEEKEKKPKILEDFLTVSEYNRPGTSLAKVNNIFVHYTANRGTSAAQNRSYFENLGVTHERAASAHFIIGYEGEIIQCIPLEEEAYAVIDRNKDSISIECCYTAEDGSFTQETYDSLVKMLSWLTDKYNLKPQDILRHYDCGGKKCPLYYVEHEDAWQKLLYDVEHYVL